MYRSKSKTGPTSVHSGPTISTGRQTTHKPRSIGSGSLLLIGIGGIIGAGFFLGCGVPIHTAGPAVLIAFLLGGLITAQVTGSLTSIAIRHPVAGSFKVYTDMYVGSFAGYLQGWIYYITGVLTIASEAVAMGVFTKVWLPTIPLWISSLSFSAIIVIINLFGVRSFDRIESLMTVVKIAALIGFIIFAGVVLFGGVGGAVGMTRANAGSASLHNMSTNSYMGPFFPHGFNGIMQSMLIVIFAYAGIGVFATAATEVSDGKKVEQSAVWTIFVLTSLYLLAIGMLLGIEPWQEMSTNISPFVLAFTHHHAKWLSDLFNGAILIASFSVMAGSVFSSAQILTSLGTAQEAPKFVAHTSKRGVSYGALLFTAAGIALAIGAAYLLPSSVYNFLISASSFMTFFYWGLMLWTFLRWRKTEEGRTVRSSRLTFGAPYTTWLTMLLFAVLTVYALFEPSQRIAFYAFVAVLALLSGSYLFVRKYRMPKQ